MKLRQVAELLNARVLTDEELLENEVENVFCSDLMADVLRYASSDTVLVTRLLNQAVVRSSMMAEVHCVVFPEDVEPPADLLALAELHDIAVMATKRSMFEDVETLLDAGLSDASWV